MMHKKSSLRMVGRVLKSSERTKSEFFFKSEPADSLQLPQIKEEESSPSIKKRRKINQVKIEIKSEHLDEQQHSDAECKINNDIKAEKPELILTKLTPSELEELNAIEPISVPSNREPKNWKAIYKHVKLMRSKIIAPVDTMGCAEIPNTLNAEIKNFPRKIYRFQLLVSLILSSQTKDEVNFKAMSKMKDYFQSVGHGMGITVDAMMEVDEKRLDELIYSVGFHSRKASYLKKVAMLLATNYNGDIPDTLEGLIDLPGVGPKMAFLTLQKAWNMNVGIGVDTHVDRLAKMWRWVDPKRAKTAEHTRKELESWLPMELWNEINPMLVGFGQVICLPRGRRCDLCTLSRTNLCCNVDRALLRKMEALSAEEVAAKNKTLRGDISLLKDIEDLA